MALYIYLFVQDVVIKCIGTNCTSVSVEHFTALLAAGALELVFELPMIARIFKDKENGNSK